MSKLISDQMAPERIRKLKILARVAGQIHAARNEKETLRLLVTSAMELVDACCGAAGLLMHEQMVFREYHQNGAWMPVDYSFGPGQGVPGWMIENRKSYFSNDAEHDPVVDRQSWQSLAFYNLIDVPIIGRQGQLLGCFNIHNSVGHRPFDEQDVVMLEMLAENAALALENLKGLEQQKRSYQSEIVLNKLLQLSMQDMPLSELLEQALETILDTPWLPLNRTGAIFLVDKDKPEVLEMKVQQGLSVTLQSTCASVPFGCCICGAAAANREAMFAEHGDERHDFCRDSMGEHAHYAIPLLNDGAVLGLITLYLDKGHQHSDRELDFLSAAACILAGVILRKQGDDLLAESERQYRTLVESTQGISWRVDLASRRFTFISSRVEQTLGYPVDSWTDLDVWIERIHPEDRTETIKYCTEATERCEDHDFAYRMLAADGRIVWIRDVVHVVRDDAGPVELVGFMFDISEEKQAAEALHAANIQFSGILDIAPDAIISVDETRRMIVFNKGAEHIFGYARQEVIGQLIDMLLPARFAARLAQLVADFGAETEASRVMGIRGDILALRKDGEEFPSEASISKIMMDGQRIYTVVLRDISVRKRAEAEMRKLSQAIEQGDEGVLMTDTNSVIEYVNPAFCHITGYTAEEVIGKTPAILKSTAQDPDFYKEMWQTISSGKIWHGTLIDRRKDGSYYPAQTTVAPVRSESGEITHYVGMQRDMTEQHKLEEQFRQAQKMEAIGTLVGGIAHDFNNMLSGMLGNLYMAKRRIGDMPEAVHKLEDVEQLGYQAANMIAQLLTFARKGRMEMVAFDFTSFVKESIKMARVSIPENIKLAENITGLDMIITGDATQLQQVLLNLLNNARDAVMDQAEPAICIQLDHFEEDEGFMSMHQELESTSFAHLTVYDNG